MWIIPILYLVALVLYFVIEAHYLAKCQQGKPVPRFIKRIWDWL